jgi:hypothetical protein
MFKQVLDRSAWRYCFALCVLFVAPWAYAGDVEITAVYRPSDNRDDFVNTTPKTGFCTQFQCDSTTFSVALPITYERSVLSGVPPLPQRWSLQVPGERQITVTSDRGDAFAVKLHITHVSQALTARNNEFALALNPAAYSDVGGGCSYMAGEKADDGKADATFVWQVSNPVSPGLCYPTAGSASRVPITPYARSLSIGYRLVLPKPYTLPSGTYKGSVTYTVGESADFALGSGVAALSTNAVTLDLVLTVRHELSVRFPANSDRVVLEPVGISWAQWLRTGVAPRQLRVDLPFRLTASGPFTVEKICGENHPDINYCRMRNQRTNGYSTFRVQILPPAGIEYEDTPGDAVRPRTLKRGQPLHLVTTGFVSNGLGRLIFETDSYFTTVLLKTPGDDWSGLVTLVFDAKL